MRSLVSIFILFALTSIVQAQSNIEWKVVRNNQEVVNSKELQRNLLNKSQANAHEEITKYFFSIGYLNAQIDSTVNQAIYINQGCLFTVGNISLVHSISLDVYELGIKVNDVFTEKDLQEAQFDITQFVEAQGYPFVEVAIAGLSIDRNRCKVDISLNIEEGELWFADDILFSQTERVGKTYLKKVSGYEDSTLITQSLLNNIQRNLSNTSYFSSVSDPELIENTNGRFIYVQLEERNPNYFDGIVGYVPDPSGTGQVAGEAKLGLVNTISDGSELNLLFQRLRPENTRLNIGFDQNWVGNIPIGVGAEFKFFQQDTNYQARSFSLKGYYQVSPNLRILGKIQGASITANDENVISATEVDGSRQLASLGFEYSTLNRPLVPTSGLRFSLSFGRGRKVISPDDENLQLNRNRVQQRELESTLELYIPLKTNQVLALKGVGYFIDASFYTEVDLFRFGGANSFRGYSEEQFFANQVGWGELEYRYLLNLDSYLFTFGTVGGFNRPELITELNEQLRRSDFLYSFGFGLSYLTNIGQLKFSYGISPQDQLSNAKVHFGIVTAL